MAGKKRATSVVPIEDCNPNGSITKQTGIYTVTETPEITSITKDEFDQWFGTAKEAQARGHAIQMVGREWKVVEPDTPEKALDRAEKIARTIIDAQEATDNAKNVAGELRRVVARQRRMESHSFLAGLRIGALAERACVMMNEGRALEGLHQNRNRQKSWDGRRVSTQEKRRIMREISRELKSASKVKLAFNRLRKSGKVAISYATYQRWKAELNQR